MSSLSRATVRSGLATLLGTALVGDGLPAQAVYDYQVGDFEGASPVVVVSSAGSERTRQGMGSVCWSTDVYLQIDVFVLYSDEDSWTESDAEDRLDAIEAAIADVLLANASSENWNGLKYEGRTETLGVEIGGVEYRREVILVKAEVMGD